MLFFSSKRERRLWLWLVVVLAGIYSTLGQAPVLAAALRANDALRNNLFFALFVILSAVAILFIRRRPGRAEIAVGAGVGIVFVVAWLRIGSLEERTHLFEYGLVAALVHEALLERRANGRSLPYLTLSAFFLSVLLGWLDEGIQALLPNRVYDLRDVFFNSVAAGLVIGARWGLDQVRRWTQGRLTVGQRKSTKESD